MFILKSLLFTTVFLTTFLHLPCFGQENVTYDSLYKGYIPPIVKYDTIKGEFLYECLISAYIEGGDAVMKGDDFIPYKSKGKDLYKNGIFTYFSTDFRYKDMMKKNPLIHYDSSSLYKKLGEIRYNAIVKGYYRDQTEINPICQSFYEKIHMNIEVLNLGFFLERVPLRMNCKKARKYMKKHNNRNYEMLPINVYLITNIFEVY